MSGATKIAAVEWNLNIEGLDDGWILMRLSSIKPLVGRSTHERSEAISNSEFVWIHTRANNEGSR